jgi:hypothetical protein
MPENKFPDSSDPSPGIEGEDGSGCGQPDFDGGRSLGKAAALDYLPSVWNYLDVCVPAQHAVLWAKLRSQTVPIIEDESPRRKLRWKPLWLPAEKHGSSWAAELMVENRPPLAVNPGGGYRKPKFVWLTPVEALRMPSYRIPGLTFETPQLGLYRADDTEVYCESTSCAETAGCPRMTAR